MEIREDQLDERTLLAAAGQVIALLCSRDFDTLTQRFTYALAYDRDPAIAVATDLDRCLAQVPRLQSLFTIENATYKVGYFRPNDVPLHASVECRFESPWGDTLEVDMVVIGDGRMDLALEDIVAFPAHSAA